MKSCAPILAIWALTACGTTKPAPMVPSEASTAADETASEEPPGAEEGASQASDDLSIPESCSGTGACVPDSEWVEKLCNGVFQDVALYLFRAGTPWQRMYLTRETEAVNASGGASVSGTLAFDEEVLILRHRGGDSGGIQVSGSNGSYDALRWNGSCVTLDGSEVTAKRPPRAKHSRVEWRWLGDETQAALREDETINETYRARRNECKGVTMGAVTKKCEQLDRKLVDVVVSHVRDSSAIPLPEEKP